MYIASNDIKKYKPHPGWKIYIFQNTLMTSHECGATLNVTWTRKHCIGVHWSSRSKAQSLVKKEVIQLCCLLSRLQYSSAATRLSIFWSPGTWSLVFSVSSIQVRITSIAFCMSAVDGFTAGWYGSSSSPVAFFVVFFPGFNNGNDDGDVTHRFWCYHILVQAGIIFKRNS